MALGAQNKIGVDDISMIATSFPNFQNMMENLGAEFQE